MQWARLDQFHMPVFLPKNTRESIILKYFWGYEGPSLEIQVVLSVLLDNRANALALC